MRVAGCAVYVLLITGASAGFFGGSSSTPELALKDSYAYCIVGAGPGGLQLGHYLHRRRVLSRLVLPNRFILRFCTRWDLVEQQTRSKMLIVRLSSVLQKLNGGT